MAQKVKILYAEDDETLAFLTRDSLLQQQYDVDHYADGKACLKAFKSGTYDICVFDIMLPGLDGFALATEIRKLNKHIPIIFLSAKTLKEDRIKGLRLGADDYLVKPFSMEELALKIEIFLNRSQKKEIFQQKLYKVGGYDFEVENYTLKNDKEEIKLTQKEAKLLKFFLDNKNKVLKREEMLTALWGQDDYFLGRSMDVFVSRLRKIFSKDDQVRFENVHGIGFRFVDKSESEL
ncbi:MAG: response regulator transcription factor [Bacteroidetes bacterium]|jgi:DNA-binding response OmpR family regulator|nr:response regulator transcription factor [Bacteroidota bacterium]